MEKTISVALFDLDRTLLDTEKLVGMLKRISQAYGINPVAERQIYWGVMNTGAKNAFSLEAYVAALRKATKHDPRLGDEAAEKVKKNIRATGERLLIPGAQELLRFCKKKGIACYVLTLGLPKWQTRKILWTKLDEFFDEPHRLFTDEPNTEKGKMRLIKERFAERVNGRGMVFFNDRADELAEFLQKFPEALAFGRFEPRDSRARKANFQKLAEKFPERVYWSENLADLQKNLETIIS
ncbi:MAG: hypothetical protein A3F54_01040 [Candidatus Kerfeldbacteria bacterium RIFCSPHIGHO2_12_FULL_48_17]|uniref:HAD family hydrolase n=1 Tax=Candidatus Kerfeldbacteria bacterium RIFCSPHIGHO2_12_FULL_48_17 TaxID=1798542 RepID=A0A1G2AXI8_9BACT|nr:MAG: hypothetical protein A3F54_01040 [Candidatus Kerfeldbacteria bacterium RIFCSPHIGHO2_12_FULL_48_17]